jgi:predicted small lipoprotein YifL
MKATFSQTSLFFLVIFTTLILAGCGQSGPLYLPEKQKSPTTNQTQQAQSNSSNNANDTQTKKQDD